MNYYEKLKLIRKSKNLTMKEVTHKANISQSSLSYIESGSNTPTIETLANILNVYGMTLSNFFDDNSSDTIITPELKELLDNAKNLTPKQLAILTEFLKTLK